MAESDEFAGKQVTVMGLGRFGGGVGVTRFLVDCGADVLVTDQEPADKLQDSVAKIQDLVNAGSVQLRLGEHNVSDFTTCDLVVVNPAVKPGNRFVRAAEAAGVEVTTEMRLLVQRLPNRLRTIGVTGSAGKSTVTAMIGHVLRKVLGDGSQVLGSETSTQHPTPNTQQVWVGGNIGVSLLPVLDQIGQDDWVVLELSSFMLERLKKDDHFPGWSPHIAVITNISPNHLDWHGTMEEYVAAKAGILSFQLHGDHFVFGNDVLEHVELPRDMGGSVYGWTEESEAVVQVYLPDVELAVPGEHNRLNAGIAAEASRYAEADLYNCPNGPLDGWTSYAESYLTDFPGLPHRLQLVSEHNGVRYFNDSKCTTPEAAQLAIQAFTEDATDHLTGVHLILGGKDKGSDMKLLAGFASEKCKAVYTIGALGETIAGLVEDASSHLAEARRPDSCGGVSWPAAIAEVVRCGDLDTAVNEIQQRVQPGDVVLLSPACASWDQFENYEQRGERFIKLVTASNR